MSTRPETAEARVSVARAYDRRADIAHPSATDAAFVRRLWVLSLAAVAPILRELALNAPTRAMQAGTLTAAELEKAAHVIERTAQSLQRSGPGQ